MRIRKPSPATVIALTALAVALGGAAYATIPDSSGAIHGCYQKSNGNLRVVQSATECRQSEASLNWSQQGPPGPPGHAAQDEVPAEDSTTSDAYVDLGGPSVTVNVPATGLVAVFARVEIRDSDGCGFVRLAGDDTPGFNLVACAAATFRLVRTSILNRGSIDGESGAFGDSDPNGAGWITVELSPGPHTFSLEYRTRTTSADTASFRNRKLWVVPVS